MQVVLRKAASVQRISTCRPCALPRARGLAVCSSGKSFRLPGLYTFPLVASICIAGAALPQVSRAQQAPSSASRQCSASATADFSAPAPKPYTPAAGGFSIHRIAGDGACMFRAIVQGVQVATKGVPMSAASEATAAHNLRLQIVQEMKRRKEEIEPFLIGITDGMDFDEYLTRMSHSAAWGGEPEMVMAVNIIRRPITVYRIAGGRAEPVVTYGEELAAVGSPIHLLWSGMHYDLLIPEDGKPEGTPGREA